MKRLDFFIKAVQAGAHLRTAWVISAFSLVYEDPDAWKKNIRPGEQANYPYRIVQTPGGYFFVNPDKTDELIMIEDYRPGSELFDWKEEIDIPAGTIANLKQDIHTTYGNLFFNALVLVYAFGDKIPYQNGDISSDKLDAMVVEILRDDPPVGAERDPRFIYTDELLRYTNAMFSLGAYSQTCVPSCTERSMTAPPGIKQLRDRLLAENKDRLHDPAVIAKIDAELVQALRDWLKDDPSMGFLTKKSFETVRKKLFLMNGAEQALDAEGAFQLVTRSLSEGWSMDDFAALCTGSRSGSYNRGAQTELGGEAVKWLFRASSNLSVTAKDCGSNLGNYFVAKPGEEHKLLGFTALIEGQNIKIDKTNVGEYMGKRVLLRSPMYCKMPKTDFCETCIGDRLANSPRGLSTAIAHYGDTFMALFMKAMHSNALEVQMANTAEILV